MREGLIEICSLVVREDAYKNSPAHLSPIRVMEQWRTLIKGPRKIEQSLSFEAMAGQVRLAAERLMEVHHIFGGVELPLSHDILAQRLVGQFEMIYEDAAYYLRWNVDQDNQWSVYYQPRGKQDTGEVGKSGTLDDAAAAAEEHRKGQRNGAADGE